MRPSVFVGCFNRPGQRYYRFNHDLPPASLERWHALMVSTPEPVKSMKFTILFRGVY